MISNALKVTLKRTKMLKEEKNVLFDDLTECRAFAVLVVSANSRNPQFFLSFNKKFKKKTFIDQCFYYLLRTRPQII